MSYRSSGFGEVDLGRFALIETGEMKEDLTKKVSLEGQESSPPATVEGCTFLHEQITGLQEGRLVPVTFRDKDQRDGYFIVDTADSTLNNHQDEVVTVDWKLSLIRQGSVSDVDLQSRLTGAARSNDFSLTGQSWHAPAIGHTGYYTGSTTPTGSLVRSGADGNMTVYVGIPDSSPRWGCPVDSYKDGRVRVTDTLRVASLNEIEGVFRELSTTGWELSNGLVRVSAAGPAGVLDIATWRNGAYHSKLVNVQLNGSNVSAWDTATLLHNEFEQVSLRLTATRDMGRVTLDLVLKRGSRTIEGYLNAGTSSTLTVQARTNETFKSDQSASGYVTKTQDDADGLRFVCGSARSFTMAANGGVSKSSTTTLDFFWGATIGAGATNDNATALRDQYIGARSESVYAVRR